MMEIKIIIPTSKRHATITTHRFVEGAALCVPESELLNYQRTCPLTEIITHPDSVIGLAPKRNWIYKKFKNVMMLDDDLNGLRRMYIPDGKFQLVSPLEAYDIVQMVGNMAHLCGCYLFGFSTSPNPLMFKPMKPIELTGFVNGCALGLLEKSGLEFIKETTAVEDFYISALNAYKNRMAYIDTRFIFAQKGYANQAGGQSQYRTEATEMADTLLLRKKFGEAISLKMGTAKAKNTNRYGRKLTIPF